MPRSILLHLLLQPQEDAGLRSCVCCICLSHRDIWGTLGYRNDTICLCLRDGTLSCSIILIYYFIFYYLWKLTRIYVHSWKEILSEILCSSNIPLIFLSKEAQVYMLAADNNPNWKLAISHCFSQNFFLKFSQKWISNEGKSCHLSVQ